jgi:hypothetical protein
VLKVVGDQVLKVVGDQVLKVVGDQVMKVVGDQVPKVMRPHVQKVMQKARLQRAIPQKIKKLPISGRQKKNNLIHIYGRPGAMMMTTRRSRFICV